MKKANFEEGRGYTKADWDEVSDNPEWTEEDFRNAKPFAEIFPELAASIRRQEEYERQGGKTLVSLQLSPDVVDAFRAGGPDWQTRMDDALRKAVGL